MRTPRRGELGWKAPNRLRASADSAIRPHGHPDIDGHSPPCVLGVLGPSDDLASLRLSRSFDSMVPSTQHRSRVNVGQIFITVGPWGALPDRSRRNPSIGSNRPS